MRRMLYASMASVLIMGWSAPVWGDHAVARSSGDREISGVITRFESNLIFVKTPKTTRTISLNKAERMGLHNVKIGDKVLLVLDSGNVLKDVHPEKGPIHGHRYVTGTLAYADPFWQEVQVSTPEGIESFEVDALMGSKLSNFQEGSEVTLELDEANMMIDVQEYR